MLIYTVKIKLFRAVCLSLMAVLALAAPAGARDWTIMYYAICEPDIEEETAFIPPQPERMPMRAPRMPRIEDLPLPAQNEIRAKRGELADAHHPEKRQRSLLQRLASVGLGRREEGGKAPPAAPRAVAAMPGADRLPGRPMPRPSEPRPEPVSEYAYRH